MEQVTTFMEKELKNNLRNEDEKTLTKAMINNYTKNKIMPPPVKKRYSREHLIFLIYIYYMKNVMSISENCSNYIPKRSKWKKLNTSI